MNLWATVPVVPGDPVVAESSLSWMLRSLGSIYGLLILLAGLLVFVGACAVVVGSRRPAVIAAYLVFLPLPLLISALAVIYGALQSCLVLAASTASPRPSEIAWGMATVWCTLLAGLIAMLPSYAVLGVGLFVRTLSSPQQGRENDARGTGRPDSA